ncbi:phage major capsid protein [Marinococcus luteus]|uniref:phage major capsid protein n=1 Tax=Marinococcus luteus TaxID=1122204 RepID=UPI002ACD0297|nr:phage major capsid protein [Marinococcus luteus]MDZ5782104.1 phage major capsid protein [Marinococcus luteus]
MEDNAQLLKNIQNAVKAIQTSDIGSSVLSRQKQSQFVRTVSEATRILDDARQINMNSHTYDIDRIGFASRFMRGANEGEDPEETSKPNFDTNTLEAKELIAIAGFTDSTLEDNIEGENFENTLLTLIADRSGVDLEELFLNGDRDSSDSLLQVIDGWLKKAANELDGGASEPDFDTEDVETMFDEMINGIDKKYLRRREDWKLYVHWDIEDSYRNLLRDRGTGLGDSAQTQANRLAYKGFEIVDSSSMPEGNALLVPRSNLVYGMYRDVRIEPDRKPRQRLTDFITTMRVDCHYEDENAAIVAKGFEGSSS